ncbi:uncharacterized, partial [Tachysurus ichikawai]
MPNLQPNSLNSSSLWNTGALHITEDQHKSSPDLCGILARLKAISQSPVSSYFRETDGLLFHTCELPALHSLLLMSSTLAIGEISEQLHKASCTQSPPYATVLAWNNATQGPTAVIHPEQEPGCLMCGVSTCTPETEDTESYSIGE